MRRDTDIIKSELFLTIQISPQNEVKYHVCVINFIKGWNNKFSLHKGYTGLNVILTGVVFIRMYNQVRGSDGGN